MFFFSGSYGQAITGLSHNGQPIQAAVFNDSHVRAAADMALVLAAIAVVYGRFAAALYLDGEQWKGWDGRLLVGMMRGQRIVALQLDARGMAVDDATVDLPSTRTRALVQGPEGNLFTANDDGEIWRVVPN